MPVVTTNDRIGKVEVFDYGLQFAFVFLGDLPAKDHGDLLGLADGPIHVQQAFREFVHGGTAEEDQIVAVLHLREEQSMLTADLSSFLRGEEGRECRQPLLPALQQIAGGERVGQRLQPFRVGAAQEGVLALLKIDPSCRIRIASQ